MVAGGLVVVAKRRQAEAADNEAADSEAADSEAAANEADPADPAEKPGPSDDADPQPSDS